MFITQLAAVILCIIVIHHKASFARVQVSVDKRVVVLCTGLGLQLRVISPSVVPQHLQLVLLASELQPNLKQKSVQEERIGLFVANTTKFIRFKRLGNCGILKDGDDTKVLKFTENRGEFVRILRQT